MTLAEGPVVLRPLRLRDVFAWRNVRLRNAEWLRPWEPTHPQAPLHHPGLSPYFRIARGMRADARHGRSLPWVVLYENRFVGQVTVGGIIWGAARSAHVGYWIDQEVAGRGIMPTALAMAVDHCFRNVGLHRIEANIRPDNTASRRVVEKLGFRHEGLRCRYLNIAGAWRDHTCYAITAEDAPGGLLAHWRATRPTA